MQKESIFDQTIGGYRFVDFGSKPDTNESEGH